MSRRPDLITIVGAAAGLALFGLAMPVLAHDPPVHQRSERIIVLDGARGAGDHDHRRIEAVRPRRHQITCEGERTEIDERTGGAEHTRILLCSDDKLDNGERADRLEKTLEGLRGNDRLSAEHRAKIESALQTAIAKLRESR